MVFTLHRYMFRELLRIFILATVALTLIVSLGMILRTVQEFGVGPRQAVHVLVIFMPITLTFVLPMAALFASALSYGRFASDNELDACRASGIGVGTLVYPGLVLAILVAIGNLVLSFHVMPYFVHMAEKSLKADAKQILFRNIQRRGFYRVPTDGRYTLLIYADQVDLEKDTLHGIVIVQASPDGIRRIITSDETRVQFDPHDKFNEVHLTTHNTRQMGVAAGDLSYQIGDASITREFGPLLGDNIKFKKIEEMKRIRADLMQFDPIGRLVREVHSQYVTELLARDVNEVVASGRSYELRGPTLAVRFGGTRCELRDSAVITLTPPVVVDEFDRSGRRRRLECEQAEIWVEQGKTTPGLSLQLYNPRVKETGQLLVQYAVRDLTLPAEIARGLGDRPLLEEVTSDSVSRLAGTSGSILAKRHEELLEEIAETLTDIKAEINSRLVFGIGCVPMILIGIGLGIIQRGGHLLGAFGASCLPAAVLIVSIISGKHITQNLGAENAAGILIMWGGLTFLILLTAVIYRKLRRT